MFPLILSSCILLQTNLYLVAVAVVTINDVTLSLSYKTLATGTCRHDSPFFHLQSQSIFPCTECVDNNMQSVLDYMSRRSRISVNVYIDVRTVEENTFSLYDNGLSYEQLNEHLHEQLHKHLLIDISFIRVVLLLLFWLDRNYWLSTSTGEIKEMV